MVVCLDEINDPVVLGGINNPIALDGINIPDLVVEFLMGLHDVVFLPSRARFSTTFL